MARGSFGLGKAIGNGWDGFKSNAAAAILGLLVWLIVYTALAVIPFVNLAILILAGPLVGGLMTLMLNLAKRSDPKIGDVFAGFSKFGRYLGLFWLFTLMILLAYIPAIIGFAVGAVVQDQTVTPVIMGVGGLISVIVVIYLATRFLFVWHVVADNWEDGSVMAAFRKSSQITEGNRLKLFGSMIVLTILAQIGFLLLGVGILLTGPIANIAIASVYLQLKESAGGASASSGQAAA